MQGGMGPEICFQSAMMRDERLLRRQMAGEIWPVMRPDRPARVMIGSSDSPRRIRSATRPVDGSQDTPYH
ncbi:hypothetical protein IEQ34_004901 [Dendrobium chrysotoxum]|uniref:Uncharacterized protein n=1 Tax=Dendrobium chrysotoxum TaxID=161865 RepID=A0AAV7HB47_DENCH|nr:hypothetical protein IEQ34_004901 [Dendrobium chrysotoxum]